jgi:ATP-dependent Lon protease
MAPLVRLNASEKVLLPFETTTIRVRQSEDSDNFGPLSTILSEFTANNQLVVIGFVDEDVLQPVGLATVVTEAYLVSSEEGRAKGHIALKAMQRVSLDDEIIDENRSVREVRPCREVLGDKAEVKHLSAVLKERLDRLVANRPGFSMKKFTKIFDIEKYPGVAADMVGSLLAKDKKTRLGLLHTLNIDQRLKMVIELMDSKLSLQATNETLSTNSMEKKYLDLLERQGAGPEVVQAAKQEVAKLAQMTETHPYHSAQLAYLDVICSLPWNKVKEKEIMNLQTVRTMLDSSHYGMGDVKKRIVEYVAVLKMKLRREEDPLSPILLLVGPPGTGKTTIARSIASCLDKVYQRISLGGVRDEAEIRGHRRTYVGSFPGKVINAMKNSKESDPLILIDEIDKIARDHGRGDVSAALLELLDPEQNKAFMDHYLNLPFDMSRATFICTANTLDTVPAALIDRCEVVELQSYTIAEKRHIARNFLLPDVVKQCGINEIELKIVDEALDALISEYTREAGVRALRQALDAICRHVAVSCLESEEKVFPRKLTILLADLDDILGPPRFSSPKEDLDLDLTVGSAMGLVWTPFGGLVQAIECCSVPGDVKNPSGHNLVLTGMAGEVLEESATIALSWLKSNADRILGCGPVFQEHSNIHIHLPAGAVRKDGPSAGITLLVALFSLITGERPRPRTAFTGEITLRGHILPVGGIKEKLIAAHTAGIQRVFLPAKNMREAQKCVEDEGIVGEVTITPISFADEALRAAFSLSRTSPTLSSKM